MSITQIKLWRVSDGTAIAELAHSDEIKSMAFSPDGQTLASASGQPFVMMAHNGDLSIRLWRVADGARIRKWRVHGSPSYALAWSPDSARLASGGWEDQLVKLWRIK